MSRFERSLSKAAVGFILSLGVMTGSGIDGNGADVSVGETEQSLLHQTDAAKSDHEAGAARRSGGSCKPTVWTLCPKQPDGLGG